MNIYSSRINGYALLSLFIGVFVGDKWGKDTAFIFLIPAWMIWLMIHDQICYRRLVKKSGAKHE